MNCPRGALLDNQTSSNKIFTLKTAGDFARLKSSETKWVTPGFILVIVSQNKGQDDAPHDTGAPCRFAVIASKKIGKAVLRNRAKRRLRALAQDIIPAHSQPGLDYLFIARPAIIALPFEALQKDLKWAMTRLAILKNNS